MSRQRRSRRQRRRFAARRENRGVLADEVFLRARERDLEQSKDPFAALDGMVGRWMDGRGSAAADVAVRRGSRGGRSCGEASAATGSPRAARPDRAAHGSNPRGGAGPDRSTGAGWAIAGPDWCANTRRRSRTARRRGRRRARGVAGATWRSPSSGSIVPMRPRQRSGRSAWSATGRLR